MEQDSVMSDGVAVPSLSVPFAAGPLRFERVSGASSVEVVGYVVQATDDGKRWRCLSFHAAPDDPDPAIAVDYALVAALKELRRFQAAAGDGLPTRYGILRLVGTYAVEIP
jgi:hypothetical protein